MPPAPPYPPPPPPVPMKVTLQEGSVIAVRLGETLNSEKNHIGDAFTGSLAEAVVVDGMVIAERGARVSGKIVDAERAGRVKGVAVLQLALTEINTADNQRVAVLTDAFLTKGPDTTKSDVAKVGIAAGMFPPMEQTRSLFLSPKFTQHNRLALLISQSTNLETAPGKLVIKLQ